MQDIDADDTDDVNIDIYSDTDSDEEDLQDLDGRFCNYILIYDLINTKCFWSKAFLFIELHPICLLIKMI